MTVLALAVLAWVLPHMINWLFVQAVWSGPDRTFCATTVQGGIQPDGWSGACWAFVNAKMDQFVYGRYPLSERWRPTIVGILFIVLLVPMLIPRAPRKGLNAILLFIALPLLSIWLLCGGFGLEPVETSLWGGLMVTLVLSFVGIAVSLPFGVILALGRRSHMPIIRTVCIGFIEIVRGIPLIAVLFMASVMPAAAFRVPECCIEIRKREHFLIADPFERGLFWAPKCGRFYGPASPNHRDPPPFLG